METFAYALNNSKAQVVYNGDIYTKEDYEKLLAFCKNEAGAEPAGVMLGRGMVRNPALARILKGGAGILSDERYSYLNVVIRGYKEILGDDVTALHKMKEIWVYMQRDFPGKEKLCKKLFKCKKLDEFTEFQREIVFGE